MKRSLRKMIAFVVLFLLVSSMSLAIANQVWATPHIQTDDIPLYSKLSWDKVDVENRSFTLDQGGSYFELPGIGFKSKGISTKPSSDIIEFYTQQNLARLGWGLVDSQVGGMTIIKTFFKKPNTYLVVKLGGCNIVFSQQQLGVGSATEFCIWVWKSNYQGSVPIPDIQPLPTSPPFVQPSSITYSNPLPVPTFSQNDSSWKNDRQGWADPGYPSACDFCTLGGYGCWTTSYSMLYNYYSSNNTNPRNLNSNLNSGPNGGPRYGSNGAHCNNLMPGGSPYAPSGVSRIDGIPGIYNACTSPNCIDSDKIGLIQNEINAGRPVLVYVHYSGTTPQHMVIITGYSGNSTWYINDPWDGGRRTLASGALGAYIVDYIMRWNGSPPGGGSGGPSGYAYCAKENERCNFSGTKDVAYGANGNFNYKYNITGGIDCNNGTFGDPISGVGKACYTKDSPPPPSCNPNSDQVALFEHGGYNGNCKVFNKGEYPNPGSMGFANDTASSIKVGGNVKAILCKDDNYNGGCEEFNGDDGNLGDNSIGDNQVSSLKVQDRGGGSCNPNSDQVALFEHGGYNGNCKVFNKGEYPNPGSMGFANDTASSIKVGGNVKAILCKDDNYNGGCEEFNGDDGNLGDNSIGDNQVSSLKVQDRGGGGGDGVEFCDGTNYGSPCITLTAGKYSNLNDIGWYDRIESLRFKGNYVGNYHVVLSTEINHGGTPGHYEHDEANVPDPWRNRTRSIEIYYIDRNNPPSVPTLSSPGDWFEAADGAAPNLCWNSSSDPEGNNPVQYYAEVFDSAVNGNSGWTTNTCWRPSNLDNQYFTFQWRVKARDNKNKESGWSETRHFSIRQPAPKKPDLKPDVPSGYSAPLVPSSMQGTRTSNTLYANARTFIDWHFINSGNGVAPGGFYVDVYIDNERIVHYGQPDFGAGQTGGFDDWAVTVATPGIHTLKIVTDPENVVQESDENNNVWQQQFTWVGISGWKGEYFNNPTLDSNPWLTRDDANVDFNWAGNAPDPSLPVDNFSARWTRTVPFECGRYRFNVNVDDGVRLWVNNQQILNEWRSQVADFHPEVNLPAGNLPIQVEYYEGGGGALIQVSWQKLSSCITAPLAPTLASPGNGSNNPHNYDLTFQWNGVSGATEYLLEWWGGPYTTMQPCGWSSSTSCPIGQVAPGNTYSWHVKARNSAGESGWSATWTFTVQASPQPDLIIESITVDPASPNVNQAVNVTVRVKNIGTGPAVSQNGFKPRAGDKRPEAATASFYVDLFIDRAPATDCSETGNLWWSVDGLGAGASVDLSKTFSGFSAAGDHNLYAFADTNCNLTESNENNNVKGPQGIVVNAPSVETLLVNGSFESDANADGKPDGWGNGAYLKRVGKPKYDGSYAMRILRTDNLNANAAQTVGGISAGANYDLSGCVNIPSTADAFTFKARVKWLTASKAAINAITVSPVYTAKTNGWVCFTKSIAAPSNAAYAKVILAASNLKATIFVDNMILKPR